MKVIVKTEYSEEIFVLRGTLLKDVIAFLNTLQANEKLLKEIRRLKIIIDDMVNKK